MMGDETAGPLAGVRVLEMGQLLAGPFTGCVLAYFGAEVIKIETPGSGDPIRNWRVLRNGTSLWWRSLARNKKCVTVDLRKQKGRELAGRIADRCDVLVENFRPGTMEKWGLGPETLKARNPELVYARISGYGQTGPYAERPGFASVCEGLGGVRYINGEPGQPPVRPNISLGDTLAAMHAVIGILMSLVHRQRTPDRLGQVVDVAIFESVFNMLESIVPEFDDSNLVRGPSGSTITGIVPTGTYPCADGKHVIIGGNNDSIFKRMMQAMGREDLGRDPRLGDNAGRIDHQEEIEAAIEGWTRTRTAAEVLDAMAQAAVPVGPIYSVQDMFEDPHFQARDLFQQVEVDGKPLRIPAIAPRLSKTPGQTRWPGPGIGAHNDEVFCDILGMESNELDSLKSAGVI